MSHPGAERRGDRHGSSGAGSGADSSADPGAVHRRGSAPRSERVVVVTGGTGGLGRWIVRRLASGGNPVHIPVREPATRDLDEELSDVIEHLTNDERARICYHACDVTDPADVEDFFHTVIEEEGRLDVLVNGVGGFTMAPVEETEPESWSRMMELNATSAFLCCRSAAPLMKAAGRGRIVNVASMPALQRGAPGMAAYGAAKAALVHLTGSLAEELVEHGVTVNAVVPTVIDTPANRAAMPDAPRDRWIDPREVAEVVAFLTTEEADVITGAAIPLSRG